jgi:hypothetical protein
VIARVSLIVPPDTYVNPAVFDIVGDRHVAQRNIQVLAVPAGKSMSFRFLVLPLQDGQSGVQIRAIERTPELDAGEVVRMAGCVGGLPAREPLAGLTVRMLSKRESRGRPSLAGDVTVPLGVLRRADDRGEEPQVDGRLDADAGPRAATVTFQVAGGEESGRLHVVDVVQIDPRTDEPQGGLTFVVKVE